MAGDRKYWLLNNKKTEYTRFHCFTYDLLDISNPKKWKHLINEEGYSSSSSSVSYFSYSISTSLYLDSSPSTSIKDFSKINPVVQTGSRILFSFMNHPWFSFLSFYFCKYRNIGLLPGYYLITNSVLSGWRECWQGRRCIDVFWISWLSCSLHQTSSLISCVKKR